MHVGKEFSFYAYLEWTKFELLALTLMASLPTILYSVFHLTFIALPLFIATIMGTTVAFVISFKNNAVIATLKEAQKLYADIQSASTFFGLQIKWVSTPANQERLKQYIPQLVNQHVAWLTALRYRLREDKPWDNLRDFIHYYRLFEREMPLEEALKPYLTQEQITALMAHKNPASYCLQLQTELLKKITDADVLEMKLFRDLLFTVNLFNIAQTNCVRLKESPYPRNFYSVTKYILMGFFIVLPFSLVGELAKMDLVWLTIPVSVLISWVFVCLSKVGQFTSNPFEGGVNDVPITTMSRAIEIELKQMLDLPDVPEELEPMNYILL